MLRNPFLCDRGWWHFYLGRLSASWNPPVFSRCGVYVDEAPGFWYLNIGQLNLSWRRRWIVWKDHPNRAENIRRYDQFDTFAAEQAAPKEKA